MSMKSDSNRTKKTDLSRLKTALNGIHILNKREKNKIFSPTISILILLCLT